MSKDKLKEEVVAKKQEVKVEVKEERQADRREERQADRKEHKAEVKEEKQADRKEDKEEVKEEKQADRKEDNKQKQGQKNDLAKGLADYMQGLIKTNSNQPEVHKNMKKEIGNLDKKSKFLQEDHKKHELEIEKILLEKDRLVKELATQKEKEQAQREEIEASKIANHLKLVKRIDESTAKTEQALAESSANLRTALAKKTETAKVLSEIVKILTEAEKSIKSMAEKAVELVADADKNLTQAEDLNKVSKKELLEARLKQKEVSTQIENNAKELIKVQELHDAAKEQLEEQTNKTKFLTEELSTQSKFFENAIKLVDTEYVKAQDLLKKLNAVKEENAEKFAVMLELVEKFKESKDQIELEQQILDAFVKKGEEFKKTTEKLKVTRLEFLELIKEENVATEKSNNLRELVRKAREEEREQFTNSFKEMQLNFESMHLSTSIIEQLKSCINHIQSSYQDEYNRVVNELGDSIVDAKLAKALSKADAILEAKERPFDESVDAELIGDAPLALDGEVEIA